MDNGKAKYYQIHDPLLYKAVAELSPQQLTGFLKVSKMILTPVKLLITQNNPIFSTTNALRDVQTAYKNSVINNPVEFIGKYFQAFGETLVNSDDYKRYKAMGGGHSSELSATRDLIKKTLRDVKIKDAGKARRLLSAMIHPIDTIAGINDFIETVPRFLEFRKVKDKTGDIQNAIYSADDVTTNFKRTGESGRKINSVIMFNNASVQGLDKLYRSFKDASPDERFKRALKYIISAVLTSALLSWFNHDKDEEGYENLSAYTKNNFYTISIGDGSFLKIPKAREMAILDSFMERLMDYGFFGDEEAFYDFGEYLANQLLPPMIPSDISSHKNALHSVTGSTAFGSFFDLMANRDFKGTPIVPKYMQDLENFQQYNEKTTLPAYWLGQIFNWSPMEVDHAISGYTGIIGQINRALLPIDGEQRDLSLGAKNKFVADSNYSTDILNKAYDERDKIKTEYTRNPTGENAINFEKYSMIADYISNVNKIINDLNPEEKRSARNGLLSKIRNWNTVYDANDKAIMTKYSSDISDGYLVTQLPKATLEETRNKSKYTYTMSPEEYSEYIDEYLGELEKQRKRVLNSYSKSPAILGEKLKEAKSEASSNIKEKYKSKFRKKFEKAG